MEVQSVESQLFAAVHLVEKGCARLLECLALGMSEIDQVGVVGQDLCRGVASLLTGAAEGFDLLGLQGGCDPLALVLGEQGEGRGPDGTGVCGGVLDPACSTYVGSEVFHVRCFRLCCRQS